MKVVIALLGGVAIGVAADRLVRRSGPPTALPTHHPAPAPAAGPTRVSVDVAALAE